MDANQYQQDALRTAGDQDDKMPDGRSIYSALGLAGEGGEVADLTKKWKFHGHPYDPAKFLDELGDAQWYLAVCAHSHGFTLEDVMRFNIDKLKKRYPDGFSTKASINRKK